MSSIQDEELEGFSAIDKLKSTDPPSFLSPNSSLSSLSKIASQFLFSSLKPYCPKSPFEELLTQGFDAEQIWQQIDLQSQPLLSSLKREIKKFENNPDQILGLLGGKEVSGGEIRVNGDVGLKEDEEFEGLSDEDEDEEVEDDEDESEEEEEDDDESEEEEEEVEDDGDGVPEVEDEFLKIKDLEKYLVREEKEEYGDTRKKKKKKKDKKTLGGNGGGDEEDDEGESEEDEDDDGELLLYGGDDSDEDGAEDNIRYDDFFAPNKKAPARKRKQVDESDDSEMEDNNNDDENEDEDDDEDENVDDSKMEDDNDEQNKGNLSTYEKERAKIQAKIKQLEAENLAPKDWTMQGEVSASKRPKDSALEVDLDFQHNMRPPPVITEEVTSSLEEIIKKRILEGRFDDVQRAPKLPSAAPKEKKELDDNKSKKGLAEIYEEEYAQQTGLVSAPLSFNDELKKEASSLFKRLCLKLDALSHFHFAPKPVVEDMAIQTSVPALAMEEIAPVAVSDAAMLAPEEVFSGKKVVKEENEFTKEDRKKRRAKKKRKLKAINARKVTSQAPEKPSESQAEGKVDS